MALIAWNESFSVGIKQIDDQHRRLLGLVNGLSDAMKEGKGKDIIGELLTDLITYTVFHFSTEEIYFRKYRYPDFLKHKQEHQHLTRIAADLKEKFDRGEASITAEVIQFLRDCMNNHMLRTDKEYSPFLIARGLG